MQGRPRQLATATATIVTSSLAPSFLSVRLAQHRQQQLGFAVGFHKRQRALQQHGELVDDAGGCRALLRAEHCPEEGEQPARASHQPIIAEHPLRPLITIEL
eukprot:15439208-Alexandrium_andersonii.AAC.1